MEAVIRLGKGLSLAGEPSKTIHEQRIVAHVLIVAWLDYTTSVLNCMIHCVPDSVHFCNCGRIEKW